MKFDIFNNKIEGVYSPEMEDTIYIPSGVRIIGKTSFADNDKFRKIVFPDSVYKIEEGAFFHCKNLEEIIIPKNIIIIEDGAFAGCENLAKVTVLNDNIGWGNNCFNSCKNLKNMTIGEKEYRLFYFPEHVQFAMAEEDQEVEKKADYKLFIGRFTAPNFPAKNCQKEDKISFCVITKDDKEYIWYDDQEVYAILGAKYQASGLSYVDFFGKEFYPESEITANEFSMLTGCCYEGLKYWLYLGSKIKGKKIDRTEPIRLQDVLYLAHEYFPEAEQYIIQSLEEQEIPRRTMLFENGISRVTPAGFSKFTKEK